MLTRANVCYNLKQTPHTETIKYKEDEITFFFSSELYLTKFKARRQENREAINLSLTNRFGYQIEMDTLADIKLYKSLEKRGFLISVNGEYVEWHENITFVGQKLIIKNYKEQ